MSDIFVDADGCPVKEEIYKVARRYGFKVHLVANHWNHSPMEDWIEVVVVKNQFDAADNWIVEHTSKNDIVITDDIPLAARCLKNGVRVLNNRGYIFNDSTIGGSLANRELMAYLRDMGLMSVNPAPFNKKDRSRFLQRLNEIIQSVHKDIQKSGLQENLPDD